MYAKGMTTGDIEAHIQDTPTFDKEPTKWMPPSKFRETSMSEAS